MKKILIMVARQFSMRLQKEARQVDAVGRNMLLGGVVFSLFLTGLAWSAPPPPPAKVTALPAELVEILDPKLRGLPPGDDRRLDVLIDFMLSASGLHLSYIAAPTHNVADTFIYKEGNCLSFTLLFLALAEHAGVDATAREVRVPASWRSDAGVLFQTSHVNVLVTTRNRRAVVDFEPDPAIARRNSLVRRGVEVSADRVLAHFYNNRAAEILANGDLETARQWSKKALELDPSFVQALNNRGVIEKRLGELEQARRFYNEAIELAPENTSTLLNLINLSRETDQPELADHYRLRLEELRPQDPFFIWQVGREYETAGELRRARRMYQQALSLLPGEVAFLTSLASVSASLGDFDQAHRALTDAISEIKGDQGENADELERLMAMKMDFQAAIDLP